MTFKEKAIIRILLVIAKLLCEDDSLRRDIEQLSTHISVHAKEA